jgi:hypothetical protein
MRCFGGRNEGGANTQTGIIVVPSTAPRAHARGPGMLRTVLVVASFLVMTCAACSDGDSPKPPSPSPTSAMASSSATSPSVPPELAGFTTDEREAFALAVAAYDDFNKRSDAFYAAGRTTRAAKIFYQKYAVDWATAWGNLGQAVNNQIRVTGTARTVWTKPITIELSATEGDSVVLRRCLDESGRIVTQDGATVDQPQFKKPHVYRVRLMKRPGEAWWRSGIAVQGQPC